jgi:CRP-like cAMP-binding protein
VTASSASFESGKIIFAQGDPGFTAYIVRQGKVLIKRDNEGTSSVIATRGPGEMIGEMALVSGARRSATAVAATDCVLTLLHRPDIERRVDESDPILRIILLTAFERLREIAEKHNGYATQARR